MVQQTPPNIAYVCTDFHPAAPMHEFRTLQEAIDWVPDYGKVKIILYGNLAGIPELVLTNAKTNIEIDGLNQYGITFDDRVVEVGASQFLKFRNMTYVRGGEILMRSDGANCGIYNTQSFMANFVLAAGKHSNVYIHNSKFYGADGEYGIDIRHDKVGIEIFDSFVQGSSGHALIVFNSNSDRLLKMKNSTILHGQPNADFPILSGGNYEIGVRLHNCSSNARICSDKISNYIVNNNNNIGDVNIIF